jgi:hypothetical protein
LKYKTTRQQTCVTPAKTKGINVVTWDYNMKTQKLLLKTVSFAGFTAPRVQEAIIKW